MREIFSGYTLGAVVLAVVALVGLAGPAFGQSKQKYKKQIAEYSKQLDELAKQDEWGISEKDRKRARQWIADAKELLAQGDVETAGWLVKQVGDAVDLVKALVQSKRIEAMADEQQETYEKMKSKKIPELKNEIEELRQRKKDLERKLRELK